MSAESEKARPAIPLDVDIEQVPPSMLSEYPVPTKTLYDPIGRVSSKHAELFWAPKPKTETPFKHLAPSLPEEQLKGLSRRSRVALHVANAILNEKNVRHIDDEYRPQTVPENLMAWRALRKKAKADARSLERNRLAQLYLTTETVKDTSNPWRPDAVKKVKVIDFEKKFDRMSAREKHHARKHKKRYEKLGRQVVRLTEGRKIPFTSKRVMGLDQVLSTRELRRLDASRHPRS